MWNFHLLSLDENAGNQNERNVCKVGLVGHYVHEIIAIFFFFSRERDRQTDGQRQTDRQR